jgi:hypothetical protein
VHYLILDSLTISYQQLVFKYLFLSASGRDLRNHELDSKHEEALEDCVLLVTRHSVCLLYPAAAASLVLPVAAQWPSLKEYALPAADEHDNDLFEAHKVTVYSLIYCCTAFDNVQV